MSDTEPPMKKYKKETVQDVLEKYTVQIKESDKNLEPVLGDNVKDPIPMVKAYVGQIKKAKDISKTITILNQKLPLRDLGHLKRARRMDILLCPVDFINESNIEKYIENIEELKDVFETIKTLEVPAKVPMLKKQFTEVNKAWSCNFHPNSYLERMYSGSFFTNKELENHRQFMLMNLEICRKHIKYSDNIDDFNAAVVVDPTINTVVAISFDNRRNHPIQHAAMLAIDNVAKTQNGGAWSKNEEEELSNNRVLSGIDKKLRVYLQEKFPNVNFGANRYISKADVSVSEGFDKNVGPYLCTGYDVYLLREPCVMCTMGLVHARARRIYFCLNNEVLGAVKSKTKLQTVSGLNHRFEVFTGFL